MDIKHKHSIRYDLMRFIFVQMHKADERTNERTMRERKKIHRTVRSDDCFNTDSLLYAIECCRLPLLLLLLLCECCVCMHTHSTAKAQHSTHGVSIYTSYTRCFDVRTSRMNKCASMIVLCAQHWIFLCVFSVVFVVIK